MPTISRFLGIVIQMYFDEHAPPHFHARYSGFQATVRIDPVGILDGALPPRVHGLVVEWGLLHREALLENWERARARRPLDSIPPME